MPGSLDPDQAQRNVGPDLGPNCLQRLSADDDEDAPDEMITFKMSQCMRFPTMWYVQPAKPQISLRICAV